jgi:hypothetical protein
MHDLWSLEGLWRPSDAIFDEFEGLLMSVVPLLVS